MTAFIFFGGITVIVLFALYLSAPSFLLKRKLALGMWLLLFAIAIASIYPLDQTIRLGLDLKGGTAYTVRLVGQATASDVQQAIEVIRKRIDKFGVGEPLLQPLGEGRILVQIPGLRPEDQSQAKKQLERVAKLEFRLVHEDNERLAPLVEQGIERLPAGYTLLYEKETSAPILVHNRVVLTGERVKKAYRSSGKLGEPLIALELDERGASIFSTLTAQNIGRRLAILLDGEVRSAPTIRTHIPGGHATITGNFTPEEAEALASVLNNPLKNPVELLDQRDVAPTLGEDSVRAGIKAAIAGLLLVMLFMIAYYRLPGVLAVATLVFNLIFLLGMLAQFGFTLTLPGIAGIILTIGMSVDASVLIYERIREEISLGKTAWAAIEQGFSKPFSSIFDANITTIITAIILLWQGSGPVQGFAVTLTLGIIGTLFASLIMLRNLFDWLSGPRGLKKLSLSRSLSLPQFDFLSRWPLAFFVSFLLFVVSFVGLFLRGSSAFGVDFVGGEALTAGAKIMPEVSAIRSALVEAGITQAIVQPQVSPDGSKTLLIRSPSAQAEKAFQILSEKFPSAEFTLLAKDLVGPVIGRELREKALGALVLALLGMLLYVTVRFEFSFAVAAIVALLHDVLLTVGIYVLLGQELTLTSVGAILAIIGYSINDTIVIFDRIREMLLFEEKGSLKVLFNRALNLTLSRTLLTSGTTLLAVLTLYFLGGPVISSFALLFLIGIIVGTYSSLFIASPLVMLWNRNNKELLKKQVVKRQQQPANST